MRQAVESELVLAKELYELVKEDSRIGFEPSCQYFYLPLDLVEKVVNCRWLLERISYRCIPKRLHVNPERTQSRKCLHFQDNAHRICRGSLRMGFIA